MELKINEITLPDAIQFNYEELKQELTEKVSKYETLVYTDDQIKDAKADRANLNKLKKALNDERLKREREYMEPFNKFKAQINEIIAIIDKPVALIDKQVKEFEEKKKADKRQEIGSYWMNTEHPEWLTLQMIFDENWLKAGTSMRSIQDNINGWINRVNTELATLEALPEFSFEAVDEYKRTLDLNKAIAEGKRLLNIQKRKEEAKKLAEEMDKKAPQETEEMRKVEEKMATDVPETEEKPAATWISFKALLTVEQAKLLKNFFEVENIEFKPI